jgi:hypothetical protein
VKKGGREKRKPKKIKGTINEVSGIIISNNSLSSNPILLLVRHM